MMDSITFEIDDVLIQLADGDARFWQRPTTRGIHGHGDSEPDIVIPIARLQAALGAAFMLHRPEMHP